MVWHKRFVTCGRKLNKRPNVRNINCPPGYRCAGSCIAYPHGHSSGYCTYYQRTQTRISALDTIVIDPDFQWEHSDNKIGLPEEWQEHFLYFPPFDPERDLRFSYDEKPTLCLMPGEHRPDLEVIPAIRRCFCVNTPHK